MSATSRFRCTVRDVSAVALAVFLATSTGAAADSWFVSFPRVTVPPIERSNVAQLLDVGVIETDGFTEMVFSLGGEFKEAVPSSGTIGAILIPDHEMFDYLLRNEGQFVFPLEVTHTVRSSSSAVFISEAQTARVAFPRYRIYLYNETTSGASVSLFVYRTRCGAAE